MRRAVGAFGLAALLVSGCSSSRAPSTSTHAHAPAVQRVAANGPVGLTAVGSAIWSVETSAGSVVARDARTGKLLRRVRVGETPLRAVYDGTSVWVSVFGAGLVVAVNPRSGQIVHRVRVGGQPEGIAAAFGAIWVVRQAARKLTRIDSGATIGPSYPLGSEPRLVTAGPAGLFVADVVDGTVTRIDPRSGNRTVSAKVCNGAQDVADVSGTLWVACTSSDRVVAVDEQSLRVTASLPVSGEPDGERLVGTDLYLVAATGPTLYRIRAGRHPGIAAKRVLGHAFGLHDQANVDLVVAAHRVWVSSYSENRLISVPV